MHINAYNTTDIVPLGKFVVGQERWTNGRINERGVVTPPNGPIWLSLRTCTRIFLAIARLDSPARTGLCWQTIYQRGLVLKTLTLASWTLWLRHQVTG